MRRLKDVENVTGHRELLALSAPQRLFVQRWMELFDWDADVHLQVRPVALADAVAEESVAEGFHKPLLSAEVAELGITPAFALNFIATAPAVAAERLAVNPDAMNHHPLYLFHAIKVLLSQEPVAFEDRVTRLQQMWTTSNAEAYTVFLRVAKLRALFSNRNETRIRLLSKDHVPDFVRTAATDWFTPQPGTPDGKEPPIVRIDATGRDPNAALECALRVYHDYRACVRAASPGLRPSELDLSTAVVKAADDTLPVRCMPIQSRRFKMRGGADKTLFARLDAASGASSVLGTFARNLAEAFEKLREGDVDSALEALILNQDLAFYGCSGHNWRYPRYLVEIGSRLVALDWVRRRFEQIEVYCRKTSHTVDPLPGIADTKVARVLLLAREAWPLISDDQRWAQIMARTAWDSLLAYHRDELTHCLSNPAATAMRVQTVVAWDLARAVRARNSLVHQGRYLQHHRLLGVLLDTYELVLRLRLAGFGRQPTDPERGFAELVGYVERDFNEVVAGTFTRQTPRSLCEDGWNGLWQ